MPAINRLKQYLISSFKKETEPAEAYNNWALNYDDQPDNLMLALDEEMINELFTEIDFINKIIVDIGCGTGRHWQKIVGRKPLRLLGFDVSKGMLEILKDKFPNAETHLLSDDNLKEINDNFCDIIISTLTVAHIKNIAKALTEWARVLKPGGEIIITDFHPDLLAKGAKRTFLNNHTSVVIKNYIHPVEKIKAIARQLNLQVVRLKERNINEAMKHYYQKQNAIVVYNKFYGSPVIYAIHLIKADAFN